MSKSEIIINTWLSNVAYSHSDSKATNYNYKMTMATYCKFHKVTPEQLLDEYEATEEKTFKRKHTQLIQQWITELMSQKKASKSIKQKIAAISSFYHYNDLPLGHIPQAREMVTYHNRDIEKGEIAQIIAQSQLREKAFYAIMAQSGLRPCTIAQLKLKNLQPLDINRPSRLLTIPTEITKGKFGKHYTCIGEDATKYLKSYLATRTGLTEESLLFCTYEKPDTPVNTKNISRAFQHTANELRKNDHLKYETLKKGKPSEIRLYNLRKFFFKKAKDMGDDDLNYMVGHALKGSNGNYQPQDPEYYQKRYEEKALPFLRIEEPTPSETKELTEALKTTMEAQHNKQMEAIKNQYEERIKTLEGKLKTIERIGEREIAGLAQNALINAIKGMPNENIIDMLTQALKASNIERLDNDQLGNRMIEKGIITKKELQEREAKAKKLFGEE